MEKMNEFNFKIVAYLEINCSQKKRLGRIFNCALMICNLAKTKGDVTFRLTLLNGTLFRYINMPAHAQGIECVSQHLYENEQPCWFLSVCCSRLS